MLNTVTVSRKHAILLRLPIPGENRYRYRLIDGDSNGKSSANGVFVNQQRCSSHELVNGDTISFGRKIQASYLTITMEEEAFAKYLDCIESHDLKSNAGNGKVRPAADMDTSPPRKQPQTKMHQGTDVLDPKGTICDYEIADSSSEQVANSPISMSEFWQRYRFGLIGFAAFLTAVLGISLTISATQSQQQQPSSAYSQTIQSS